MNQEILDYLQNVDWTVIIKKLTSYALAKIRRKSWGRGGINIPSGLQAEDIVKEAITLLYEGKRNWDKEKCPSLVLFLKGTIKSIISNQYKKKENKFSTKCNTSTGIINGFDEIQDYHFTPEEFSEGDALYQSCVDLISSKNDENLLIVFLGLADGMQAKEISQQTDIDIKEVYNLLKRIRRCLSKEQTVTTINK